LQVAAAQCVCVCVCVCLCVKTCRVHGPLLVSLRLSMAATGNARSGRAAECHDLSLHDDGVLQGWPRQRDPERVHRYRRGAQTSAVHPFSSQSRCCAGIPSAGCKHILHC
jgi:hypothetical protein